MNLYKYKDLTIELLDDPTYKIGSADNNFKYSKYYSSDIVSEYPTSKHGVKISHDERIVNSCVILGSGGSTGIHENSSLLDNDRLIICCCDTVFCLMLPDLELQWKTQADHATCFQIFKREDGYIVHGELQISKLNKNGQKQWEVEGADCFVSCDNEEELKIENDGVLLTDFSKNKYKIDFDGKLLWNTYEK